MHACMLFFTLLFFQFWPPCNRMYGVKEGKIKGGLGPILGSDLQKYEQG